MEYDSLKFKFVVSFTSPELDMNDVEGAGCLGDYYARHERNFNKREG